MGFMKHIQICNRHDLSKFVPFVTNGQKQVGWIRKDYLERLKAYPTVLTVTDEAVQLSSNLQGPAAITAGLDGVCKDLCREGVLQNWRGEAYAVAQSFGEEPLFEIERAAAAFFGVRAYGVHLNGFVRSSEGLKLWVGQRAQDRAICPGMLDNMVAGGQPAGLSLADNLVKECAEEANIPQNLARRATPVGTVSYTMETKGGLKPDTMFCYDLEVPQDFMPQNTDGETEKFYLWSVEKVAKVIREGGDFKFNCNLVIIDFLIRHGILNPDETPDYSELVKGLHR